MAFSAVMAGVGLLGTAVSTVGAYQQAQQQKAAAEYQSEVAKQNQELAQDQAKAQRKEGYEAMIRKRQEVAGLIGSQRAIAGASGAQVDQGSFLDLNLDTAEKGEMDALAIYQQGLDKAHNSEIQAWNSGQQAQAYAWQADRSNPMLAAGTTAIGGLTQVGSNFGSKLWGGGSSDGALSTLSSKASKGAFGRGVTTPKWFK